MSLGIFLDGETEQKPSWPEQDGHWEFDDVDFALYALLCDPIYCAELLCESPSNREYAGCYVVRDYQYPLNRTTSNYAVKACARATGKTESIKNKSMTHPFKRMGENMLITTPELIHLLPLTDAIEDRIHACRLTREFLDTEGGRTGFTHRPFGVDFKDNTKIVGRIPRLSGPQPLDAHVLTPGGWATMEDIRAGDNVIGSDGRATKVLGTTGSWPADVFRLEFTDGSSAEATADHWWQVSVNHGAQARTSVVQTRDIACALAGSAKGTGGTGNMYRVPNPPRVEYAPLSTPPLDPYVVGMLLGDGCISGTHASLVSADSEILDAFEARLPRGCALKKVPKKDYLYSIVHGGRGQANALMTGLRALGLLGRTSHTKFVPYRYRYGSVNERVELLRGLLDTDGSAREAGSACLISASRQLVDAVVEISRSLGGWGSTSSEHHTAAQVIHAAGKAYDHPGGLYWRAHIRVPGIQLFRLSRKVERYNVDGRMRHRSIRSVVPVGSHQVKCIKVEATDGLYLTDELIVTHNTGVKGQHQPDLLVDEAQDYPAAGWTEVHETVNKDSVDQEGRPDFSYVIYGVHSGARDTGFFRRATTGGFQVTQITALQRPGWCSAEKEAAKAAYGGTASPDYRRNILGEAGAASSPLFVTARLVACMDQDRSSTYNQNEYQVQEIHVEAFDELMLPIADVLDLPSGLKRVWAGADLGLTNSPTVILIFSEEKIGGAMRLKLVRRIHLNRMRVKQIRNAIYAIFSHFGDALQGFGIDETGLGFPIMQEIEDDEGKPALMDERFSGWFFNARCPVGIEKGQVTADQAGNLRDQYGNAVQVRVNELTNEEEYIVYMPMIEASTRYLREFVDTTFFQFPFDPEVIGDMNGDSQQRVKRIAGLKQKPNAFHILDAMRAMSMIYKSADVAEAIAQPAQRPVLDGWAS